MSRDHFADIDSKACPSCGFTALTVHAEGAAHDPSLIDIIVECEECGHRLNAFVNIDEMVPIE